MIDLLYPVSLEEYDPDLPSGEKNPGGGMVTKLLSVRNVLSQRYIVNIISDLDAVKSGIVIVEPLTPRMMDQDMTDWVGKLKDCKAKKILYCSEMEVSRWSPNAFKEVVETVDVVTANTEYQAELIRTLSGGKVKTMQLCDPIDESLFQPIHPKKIRVFGAGRVSVTKNSQFHVDLFKAVKANFGGKVETAYFGSADLWGGADTPEDYDLAKEIEEGVDVFHGGMRRKAFAEKIGESLIYASKTEHDVYSSTHVEILGCECISLGGGHPMFRERPGISGLKTIDDFLAAIKILIESSTAELTQMQKASRKYMIENCSFAAFQRQFDSIIQGVI